MVFKFSSREEMFSVLFSYLYPHNVGSGELPLQRFLEPSCLQYWKMPFHNIVEVEIDLNLKRKSLV